MDLRPRLSHAELLQLARWNTPTIYNGWERITRHDSARDGINLEPVTDYTPQFGPMAGYAVTVLIQPGDPAHPKANPAAWSDYWRYIGSVPGPKIVVVQDLDKPIAYGSAWGEVNASIHRALGCVGVIVDGAVRDLEAMTAAGFKALARQLCVGHAHACPIRWDIPVEVFGRTIAPGQLIHADQHGFLAIPPEDEVGLLEAAQVMDRLECETLIATARGATGCSADEIHRRLLDAAARFGEAVRMRFP